MEPRQVQKNWSDQELKKLEAAYKEAVQLEFKTMDVDGEELYTEYVKHLIYHLKNVKNGKYKGNKT